LKFGARFSLNASGPSLASSERNTSNAAPSGTDPDRAGRIVNAETGRGGFVMRVEVDRDRCEGNAVCVGIAPDLFDLDDEDYAVVKADPVQADQEDLAEQAIAECPRAALIRRD
jgi:ferredoxin